MSVLTNASDPQTQFPMWSDCLRSCNECSVACTTCADACLAHANSDLQIRTRLLLDCADICRTTADILARRSEPDWHIVRLQLETTAQATRSCAQALERQRENGLCADCVEACRKAEALANQLFAAVAPSPLTEKTVEMH